MGERVISRSEGLKAHEVGDRCFCILQWVFGTTFVNFMQKHSLQRMEEIKNLVESAPGDKVLCNLHVHNTIGGLSGRILFERLS